MMLARNLLVATAVCAALLAAGTADAKKGRKSTRMPVATAPASAGAGGIGMSAPMGGPPADAETALLSHFDEMDANKDGALTKQEISTFFANLRQQAAARIAAADTNGDGEISQAEADAALPMIAALFPLLDADKNGQLTREELARLATEQGRDAIRLAIVAHVRAADTNNDGRLDRNEVAMSLPGLASKFDQLDKNGDGYLTPDELRGGI
jgi:Ca2+-binding EF-hand superfamily protein